MKNRVKELRQALGWTQQQLGEQLHVSRQTINAIENQRYDPSLSLAFKISRLFVEPLEKIFEDEAGPISSRAESPPKEFP